MSVKLLKTHRFFVLDLESNGAATSSLDPIAEVSNSSQRSLTQPVVSDNTAVAATETVVDGEVALSKNALKKMLKGKDKPKKEKEPPKPKDEDKKPKVCVTQSWHRIVTYLHCTSRLRKRKNPR